MFFSPTRDELKWAADATDGDEHLLALLLMLKSYQRMGCFPVLEDVPETVVDFVRRAVELPECTLPVYRAERTAKHHRGPVRKRVGVKYDQAKARGIAEQSIRKEAAAKNRPADLINIGLEKVVEAGLELPGFSTFDKMASKIRTEVNSSIRAGIHDRMSAAQRAGLMRLLEERDGDGTTLFNRLKKPAQGPTWSHFKNLTKPLEWVDGLGDTGVWMNGVASGKITDFAGEADAADASELRDFAPVKRIALVAALTHKARMRVRDDLATMFCKRVATKIKKARAELEEIRLAEREIVEALIGNYRTVLKHIDAGGAVTQAVEDFGGFAKQYEQIEKVAAHHGNFWEVLLYGQIGRDRALVFDLADKPEFTATSEDSRVLDALAHAQRHQSARGESITAFNKDAKEVTSPSPRRTGARPWLTRPARGSSSASTSRRWSSPASPRNSARATSRWSAQRSTRTGPSSCWPGKTSRRSWGPTWWRSACARRARPPSSTRSSSADSWRTSCGPPPRRRMPGTPRTRAWSSIQRRASRR
ncbi:DUF4158 domain-containing protein [Streptomyces sp. R-74717]